MTPYKNPIPTVDKPSKKASKKPDYNIIENDYNDKKSVYFAFIDVLGFKKAFDDNREKDDYFAEKFREVFTYYFELMDSALFMDGREFCYAGQTSDSLYFYTERPDFLIEFLKIFSHLNVYAMTKDVFFRGGIAKGNLFYKQKHQFYGESVIYSYLLESEISKNPIIVIDQNTYDEIRIIPESEKLVNDKNERIYIKPFAYLENKFALDIDPYKIVRKIDEDLLYKNIKANKTKFEYDARNYGKYVFLESQFDAYKKKLEVK